ncbi:GNAT family N-acetyltransferase [Massilia sp. LXY-6]|uniref:GNAT family N-acetyltransferase n=1 Tax=Massilia sp. LXY-6 TaxID=3379823 RepID=UPI003EDEA64B
MELHMQWQLGSGTCDDAGRNTSVQIQCHENGIPEYISDEIDREYAALHASVLQMRLTGNLNGPVWSYISLSKGEIRSTLLFQIEGNVVRVLNQQMRIAAADVSLFVQNIFERFSEITRIVFFGLHMDRLDLAYPYQRFFCAEDIVIPFFDTADAYMAQVGKETRKNIRRRSAALALRHPRYRYEVREGADINEDLVALVIAFNRARMVQKGKESTYRDEDSRRLALLAMRGGLAGVVSIDDKIAAASVCCRVGNGYYMLASGHDCAYDEFSLGLLCCHWTAAQCIRRGASEVNLMGGRLHYKYCLLGKSRKYDRLEVYRSYAASMRHLPTLIDTAVRGHVLQTRFALLDCEFKDGVAAKTVARAIRAWRAFKSEVL